MDLRHMSSELRKLTNFIKPLMKVEPLLKEFEGFEKRKEDLIKATSDLEENITKRKEYLGNIEALIAKSAADRSAIIEETANAVKAEKEKIVEEYVTTIHNKENLIESLSVDAALALKGINDLKTEKGKLEKIVKGLQSIINTTSSNLNKEV